MVGGRGGGALGAREGQGGVTTGCGGDGERSGEQEDGGWVGG